MGKENHENRTKTVINNNSK